MTMEVLQLVLGVLSPLISAVVFVAIQAARGGSKAATLTTHIETLNAKVRELETDVVAARSLAQITRDQLAEYKTIVASEYVHDRNFNREIGQLRAEINGLGDKIEQAVRDILQAGGLRPIQGGRHAG